MLHQPIVPAVKQAMLAILAAVVAAGANQTTTTLTSSANPVVYGHSVTLSANVSGVSTFANGIVTFFDGSTILGTTRSFSGKASFTTSLLPPGVRSLRAYFAGDDNDVPSTSLVLKQTVTAVAGNGFQQPVNIDAAANTSFVTVADINSDGRADLVLINTTTDGGQVVIMPGNGDGTFKNPITIPMDGAVALAVMDFNSDGHPDLAVLNGTTSNIQILLGNGSGIFMTAGTFPTPIAPSGLVAGDLNNDGIPDLVVATPSGIAVLIGQGGGGFQPFVLYPAGLATGVGIGDFNNDGIADLVIATPSGVAVLRGLGDGTFLNKVNYPTGVGGGPVLVADFDGDGLPDIAAATSSSVSVLLNDPKTTFKTPIISASGASNAFVQTLALADFNGDGKADLVTTNFSGVPSSTSVGVLLGNGDGSFQVPTLYNVSAVTIATVGDINGDGVADIVTAGLGSLGIMLGTAAPVINPPPPTPPSVAPGGVLNAASFLKDGAGLGKAVAPGSLVSIFGSFPGAVQADAATVPFGKSLGGVTVTFNNIPAPVRDVIPAANEINAQMPFGVQGTGSANTVNVVVTIGGLSSVPVAIPIVPAAPGIFTIPPTGLGNAVVIFVDPADNVGKIAAPVSASATLGLPAAPVPRGTSAYFYATGLGAMTPSIADGAGGLEPPAVTHFATNPIVMIGGLAASVQFAGQAPGFPGVNQINIVIPSNAPTGDAVPIQMKSSDGSVVSNIATIAIR
jgi:uncharacterized protein (TIGR03437 family)